MHNGLKKIVDLLVQLFAMTIWFQRFDASWYKPTASFFDDEKKQVFILSLFVLILFYTLGTENNNYHPKLDNWKSEKISNRNPLLLWAMFVNNWSL